MQLLVHFRFSAPKRTLGLVAPSFFLIFSLFIHIRKYLLPENHFQLCPLFSQNACLMYKITSSSKTKHSEKAPSFLVYFIDLITLYLIRILCQSSKTYFYKTKTETQLDCNTTFHLSVFQDTRLLHELFLLSGFLHKAQCQFVVLGS